MSTETHDYRLLSIVVPVFNESATVIEIIRRMRAVPLPIEREIIVVDDASTDGSSQIVGMLEDSTVRLIRHNTNGGKGAAVRTGISYARGDIVMIQDADLEYDPSDWPRLIEPILSGKAQVVFGSRFTGTKDNMLFRQWVGNVGLTAITRLLYQVKITDMETCYKAFDRRVLQGISIESNKFDFEPEITAKVARRGYKIHEVPIAYRGRDYHEGKKITWRDGIDAVKTLLRYRVGPIMRTKPLLLPKALPIGDHSAA